MAEPIIYVPMMLATLALVLTSFLAKKKNRTKWIIIAFVIWLMTFVLTLYEAGVFNR